MITEIDAKRAARRLLDVFGTSKSEDQIVRGIMVAFDGEPESNADLMAATTWFLKSDTSYMPTGGKLLTKARELRGVGAVAKPVSSHGYGSEDGRCATCGAEPRWLKPEEQVHYGWDEQAGAFVNMAAPVLYGERYGTLHDLQKHRRAGTRCVGYWR